MNENKTSENQAKNPLHSVFSFDGNVESDVFQAIAGNEGNITGQKITYSKEEFISEPAKVFQALAVLSEMMSKLKNEYPNATEEEAKNIIRKTLTSPNYKSEFEKIKQVVFTRERWLNGVKKSCIGVWEHLAKENVYCIAFVKFVDGMLSPTRED